MGNPDGKGAPGWANPVRAAAAQLWHVPGDPAANLDAVRRWTRRAADGGAALVAFPEMCLTGYWHVRHLGRAGVEALAEPVPDGPLCRSLLALAADTGLVVGAGLIECHAGSLYNGYLVALPDGGWACHRKLHTFISPHMRSGDRITVVDSPVGRLGVLTCYDNNLIENTRLTALAGAQILLAPHQTGGCRSRSPHAMKAIDARLWHERERDPEALRREFRGPNGREWLLRWLPSRAHDNGMFLVFSNGVGLDDDEVRTGNAMILDPYGGILAESDAIDSDLVVADLDPALLSDCTGQRWLTARRPELYGPLVRSTGHERSPRQVRFGANTGSDGAHTGEVS